MLDSFLYKIKPEFTKNKRATYFFFFFNRLVAVFQLLFLDISQCLRWPGALGTKCGGLAHSASVCSWH